MLEQGAPSSVPFEMENEMFKMCSQNPIIAPAEVESCLLFTGRTKYVNSAI